MKQFNLIWILILGLYTNISFAQKYPGYLGKYHAVNFMACSGPISNWDFNSSFRGTAERAIAERVSVFLGFESTRQKLSDDALGNYKVTFTEGGSFYESNYLAGNLTSSFNTLQVGLKLYLKRLGGMAPFGKYMMLGIERTGQKIVKDATQPANSSSTVIRTGDKRFNFMSYTLGFGLQRIFAGSIGYNLEMSGSLPNKSVFNQNPNSQKDYNIYLLNAAWSEYKSYRRLQFRVGIFALF